MTRFAVIFLLYFVAIVPLAYGQARTHDITPDDYFTINQMTEITVSPDGKHVAFALATWDKIDDLRKTDVWVIDTDGKSKPIKLTFDRANDRRLKWSVDGKHLYFLGNRKREAEKKPPFNGDTQVWRIAADGSGEVIAITREVGGVTGYDYAPKSEAVFFSKDKEYADQDEFAKLRAKFKADYGHGVRKVSEIHKLDVTIWRAEKVVDETRYIREFAVSLDGKKIAMVSAFDDTVVMSEGESRVDVWEAGKITTPPTDVYRAKAASPYAWLENVVWRPDGDCFAFLAIFDAYPAEIVAGIWDKAKGSWEMSLVPRGGNVITGYGRAAGPAMQWIQRGLSTIDELGFLIDFSGQTLVASRIPTLGQSGPITPVSQTNEPEVISGYSYRTRGYIAHIATGKLGETAKLIAYLPNNTSSTYDPNAHMTNWKLPTVKRVVWHGVGGDQVGGVLELPPGYKKGEKLPLVVAIHGGPTTSTKADLSFDAHNGRLYFAAAGYAVLCPNYRGSTGYGDKFVTDLIGKENDIEVEDILAGIEYLVKDGIVDPDRVGVMGWSNGGYLTNCLISKKDSKIKFKAASSGAGIVDTVAEWGFNDEPAYPIVFKGGLPWEKPDVYKRTSPTYQLGNITTPTLIHVGGGDERCPPGHSRMLYRALKENLKVPTELVVYTGEPHGLTKMSNRKAKMEWDLAWFDKYLKTPGK